MSLFICLSVLVYSGYYNKIPQARCFKQQTLFLKILKVGSLRTRCCQTPCLVRRFPDLQTDVAASTAPVTNWYSNTNHMVKTLCIASQRLGFSASKISLLNKWLNVWQSQAILIFSQKLPVLSTFEIVSKTIQKQSFSLVIHLSIFPSLKFYE